jgi:antitoxin VapB
MRNCRPKKTLPCNGDPVCMSLHVCKDMQMLSIRDPRAAELAKRLAAQRKSTMTEAIVVALENELKREREKVPLPDRLAQLAEKARRLAGPQGREVPKDEIDEIWGQ